RRFGRQEGKSNILIALKLAKGGTDFSQSLCSSTLALSSVRPCRGSLFPPEMRRAHGLSLLNSSYEENQLPNPRPRKAPQALRNQGGRSSLGRGLAGKQNLPLRRIAGPRGDLCSGHATTHRLGLTACGACVFLYTYRSHRASSTHAR